MAYPLNSVVPQKAKATRYESLNRIRVDKMISGKFRTRDSNTTESYRIFVAHELIDETQKNLVLADYDNSKATGLPTTVVINEVGLPTFTARFVKKPVFISDHGITFDGTSELVGEMV